MQSIPQLKSDRYPVSGFASLVGTDVCGFILVQNEVAFERLFAFATEYEDIDRRDFEIGGNDRVLHSRLLFPLTAFFWCRTKHTIRIGSKMVNLNR